MFTLKKKCYCSSTSNLKVSKSQVEIENGQNMKNGYLPKKRYTLPTFADGGEQEFMYPEL